MGEPIIEHKKPQKRTPISLLEARLHTKEREAQKLLSLLEKAMVRCGYTRDGIYNSRQAGWVGKKQRGTVLYWRKGKILLGRGFRKDVKGKTIEPREAVLIPKQEMSALDLIEVASHLAPFLDSLEGKVRWQVEALEKALETIQGVIGRLEADPQPSDNPAQMSESVDGEEIDV